MMSPETSEILRRFHRALVTEIRKTDPSYLDSPFTVAEIYQNLVPYRTHRDEIGVEMNGDYEDALLRLLAGEGDYLVIESKEARQEIREELQSLNPNTGIFRNFAAADVRLNPEKLDQVEEWITGEVGGSEEAEEDTGYESFDEVFAADESAESEPAGGEFSFGTLDAPGDTVASPLEETPMRVESDVVEEPVGVSPEVTEVVEEQGAFEAEPEAEVEVEPEPGATVELEPKPEAAVEVEAEPGAAFEAEPEPELDPEAVAEAAVPIDEAEEVDDQAVVAEPTSDSGVNCPWCRESLPSRNRLNFCPFCGSNVKLVPCPECGEELEVNWRFCVACGTEVRT